MSRITKVCISKLWYFGVLLQFFCVDERWNIRSLLLEKLEDNVAMFHSSRGKVDLVPLADAKHVNGARVKGFQ